MGDSYCGYDVKDLAEAFELVTPEQHWKDPICAFVPEKENINLILVAIKYYTSTNPIVKLSRTPGTVIIMAEGYRMGPSGDY